MAGDVYVSVSPHGFILDTSRRDETHLNSGFDTEYFRFLHHITAKKGFLPEHIDTIEVGGEMIVVVKKGNMMWKTPITHEIAVGLEINNYSCAGL